MSHKRLSKELMAQRIAADIFRGAYVNLGIGMPTLVSNYIGRDSGVMLHSENGLLGMGPIPAPGKEDPDLINAGKECVTILPGGAYFDHGISFSMMRGGHIDICVLGAYQVSQNGDLANWHTDDPDAIPAVGGAMDLAVGAKNVWVMTNHTTRNGDPKILRSCTYPLTGLNCVKRIYTDLCVIHIQDGLLLVREIVAGLSFKELQDLTDATLTNAIE